MIGRAPLQVRVVSEICVALAAVLFLTALLGVAIVAVGFGFSGAVLATLSALGAIVFGTGSIFIRRRSRTWWLVLNSFFVVGAVVGVYQSFQGRPIAIAGSIVCAACLMLLIAPTRSRAFFDQPL